MAKGSKKAETIFLVCEETGDYVSRKLFADILASEEEHVDWLETQRDLIARVGLENYLQSQMSKADEG